MFAQTDEISGDYQYNTGERKRYRGKIQKFKIQNSKIRRFENLRFEDLRIEMFFA